MEIEDIKIESLIEWCKINMNEESTLKAELDDYTLNISTIPGTFGVHLIVKKDMAQYKRFFFSPSRMLWFDLEDCPNKESLIKEVN